MPSGAGQVPMGGIPPRGAAERASDGCLRFGLRADRRPRLVIAWVWVGGARCARGCRPKEWPGASVPASGGGRGWTCAALPWCRTGGDSPRAQRFAPGAAGPWTRRCSRRDSHTWHRPVGRGHMLAVGRAGVRCLGHLGSWRRSSSACSVLDRGPDAPDAPERSGGCLSSGAWSASDRAAPRIAVAARCLRSRSPAGLSAAMSADGFLGLGALVVAQVGGLCAG